jgi:hypothetical protein
MSKVGFMVNSTANARAKNCHTQSQTKTFARARGKGGGSSKTMPILRPRKNISSLYEWYLATADEIRMVDINVCELYID